MQPSHEIGWQKPERNGHRLDGIGRADGCGDPDGRTLSFHEATGDIGELRCHRCGRGQGEAQGQPAQFGGAVLHRQRGGDKAGGNQHRPVPAGVAGPHPLVERPVVLSRPGGMGKRDVGQEHHQRHRVGMEPGLPAEMVASNNL